MGAVAKSVRVFGTGALASLLYLVRCRAVYKAQSNQERPQDERRWREAALSNTSPFSHHGLVRLTFLVARARPRNSVG